MQLYKKILIAVGIVLTLGLLSFIVYKQVEISQKQQSIEESFVAQKQLIGDITRSSAEYASKDDINKLIKENGVNLKSIQDDMSKLHAELSSVNTITVKSVGQVSTNIPSTGVGTTNPNAHPLPTCPDGTVCPNVDPHGYLTKQQTLELNENFGTVKVPVGQVGFSSWQPTPWSLNIKPREYHITTVVGKDENEKSFYYNKFTIKVEDKVYDVKIDTAVAKEILPEASMHWWNPRLFAGLDAGINLNKIVAEFTPNIGIGIMSYGRFKTVPDWTFLELGIGYGSISRKGQAIITPVMYNVGKNIPLMHNMYLGPSMHLGFGGDVSVMMGMRVGL